MPMLQSYLVVVSATVRVKDSVSLEVIEEFTQAATVKASSHGGPRSIMDAVDGGMELLQDRLHNHSEATMVNERERLRLSGD